MLRLTTLLLLAACTGDPGAPSDTNKPGDDSAPVGCDTVWYADADGDGFGDPTVAVVACEPPGQEVADNTDCDDTNPVAHPGADEDCATPFDANCDGSILFEDADADGTAACEDCDDADATRKPGTAEFCDGVDQDCDGEIDEDPVNGTLWYADTDGDGAGDRATTVRACDQPDGYTSDFQDCDDADPAVHPAATETCNEIDDDCDGSVDDGAAESTTWYTDADGDSYGAGSTAETGCEPPTDAVFVSGDCDDSDATSNPGALEQCNDVDDNCDGVIDGADAVDQPMWYPDDDDDGWGDSTRGVASCDAPRAWVATGGDCDDTEADLSPGALETCDGRDEDCDGETDESDALDAATWYMDLDGDGHGDATAATPACAAPDGFVAASDDCEDADAAISPDASEICDGVDNDCDTVTDEDAAVDAEIWFGDTDGDSFGDGSVTRAACAPPAGFVGNDLDCDDTAAGVSPSATETCDGEDDDCDGVADEPDAADATDWYADSDGDGHGDPASVTPACTQPAGHVTVGDDCDDTDTRFHPGATEADCGDPNDYNCDGSVGDRRRRGRLGRVRGV